MFPPLVLARKKVYLHEKKKKQRAGKLKEHQFEADRDSITSCILFSKSKDHKATCKDVYTLVFHTILEGIQVSLISMTTFIFFFVIQCKIIAAFIDTYHEKVRNQLMQLLRYPHSYSFIFVILFQLHCTDGATATLHRTNTPLNTRYSMLLFFIYF